jgi:hypothetical protein
MKTLTELPVFPPDFTPTRKTTAERLAQLEINQSGFLSIEEAKLFAYIMVQNEEALAYEDVERGTFHEEYFSPYIIPTIPHVPWEYKNIPIPPGLLKSLMEVLQLKIDAGVYEPSESSYRSRWFWVEKKNKKLRIVHDLQPLNQVTIRDTGGTDVLDDFVYEFAGRQCYTAFDLFWGFDARKIHPKSRELTAFMTPLGLLQITSLPTGFTNSLAEFQRCMTYILRPEIPTVANVYIDDLAIKGPASDYKDVNGIQEPIPGNPEIRRFVWEHAKDVHRVMHRVKCSGATFSAQKTQICRPEALIVGQKCNAQGRVPDESRVEKVKKWKRPENVKEIRMFLGLCGTMRIWIKNYSAIVRPLARLIHKDEEFVWKKEQEDAFGLLKELITTAPALRGIDYESSLPVILQVDSSKHTVGMVLQQVDEEGRRRTARYGSIPMSERESRYSQPKLELFGLHRALRAWRRYLIGVKNLKVEMDASFIKDMLKQPDMQPNDLINRWIQGIKLFDFQLTHVPATRFKAPDALSRQPLGEGETVESDDDSWLDNVALHVRVKQDQSADRYMRPSSDKPRYEPAELPSCFISRESQEAQIRQIKQFLRTLETPKDQTVQEKQCFMKHAEKYAIRPGDRLFRQSERHDAQLVVIDPEQKFRILTHMHDKMGHKGIQAVYELVRKHFYWPHM